MVDHPLPYPGIDQLIASLRNIAGQPYQIGAPTCDTINLAADEIERLRAALKEIHEMPRTPEDELASAWLVADRALAETR